MAVLEVAHGLVPIDRRERNFKVFQVVTEEQTGMLQEARLVFGLWRERMETVTNLLSKVDREPTEWELLTSAQYEESLARLTNLIIDTPKRSFVTTLGGYVKVPIPNRVARFFL